MGVLLVASLVLLSWSIMFGVTQPWLNRDDARWLLALQLTLIMFASTIPNPYVSIVVAWVALHPWLAHIAFNHKVNPFGAIRGTVYAPLFPVLWWTALYLAITRIYTLGMWRTVAYGIILWSLLNSAAALYQNHATSLPKMWQDNRTPDFPCAPGLVGGSFMLSLITSLGALSCVFVSMADHTYYLIPVAGVLALSSVMTGTISPLISVILTCFIYLTTISIWYVLPMFSFTAIGIAFIFSPTHLPSLHSRTPAWKAAIQLSYESRFIGIGLGMWNMITAPPPEDVQHKVNEGVLWRNLHNDWIQALVELGPIPVLCALSLLTQSWTTLSTTSTLDYLYGLLITTVLSIYAIGYFPMRDHMPATLLAISLAMMNK